MVKTIWLVSKNSAIKFVNDQRPALNISRRSATVFTEHGCTFSEEEINFENADDGNSFFNQKKADGYIRDDSAGEKFVRTLYDSMY